MMNSQVKYLNLILLAEYKEDVKKQLAEKKEIDAKNEKEDKVIDAIIEGAEMVIPEAMIQTQQRQMADDFAQRLQMQGLSIDQYFQFTGAYTLRSS